MDAPSRHAATKYLERIVNAMLVEARYAGDFPHY